MLEVKNGERCREGIQAHLGEQGRPPAGGDVKAEAESEVGGTRLKRSHAQSLEG